MGNGVLRDDALLCQMALRPGQGPIAYVPESRHIPPIWRRGEKALYCDVLTPPVAGWVLASMGVHMHKNEDLASSR